jgi:hypothetical protein
MKTLSLEVDDALRGRELRYGFLAQINTFYGIVRLWSGLGTLAWNGFSWTGLGRLGRITGMGETAEVRTTETRYELSGIADFAQLSYFLGQPVRGYVARAWLALLDEKFTVIPDPVLIDKTILDTATISMAEDGTATLVLVGTSAIFDFRRPKSLAITNEQQQLDYPGDTGFDRVPTEVADKTVSWTKT